MCGFSDEQLRELKGLVAHPMVEQEGNSVREDFAQQPAGKMPQIARPHSLYAVALCELREDGVYPVAKTAEQSAPFGSRISLLRGVGGQKLYARCRQLFSRFGRMVVVRSPTIRPEVPSTISGSTESS